MCVCVCAPMYMGACACHHRHVKGRGQLWKSTLSFQHGNFRNVGLERKVPLPFESFHSLVWFISTNKNTGGSNTWVSLTAEGNNKHHV